MSLAALPCFFAASASADTTYTWYHAGTGVTQTSESTNINALDGALGNGDIFTLTPSGTNFTNGGQFNGNNVGESGTFTMQSAAAGTQATITNGKSWRLIDFAHGTYVFKDIRFYQLGASNDGGAVLYRNTDTSTAVQLDNVLVEDCVASVGSAFRSAVNLTVSGNYTMKNNTNSTSGGAVFLANTGKIILSGAGSNGVFTGTTNTGADARDLSAASGVVIQDAGTYSFGGGIYGGTLSIDAATVTLESTSKSVITGTAAVKNGATLKLAAGAVLQAAETSVTTNGKIVLTGAAAIQNLSGDSTASVSGNYDLTLNNTADTTFAGALNIGTAALTKTGANKITLSQNATTGKVVIQGGTLSVRNDGTSPVTISGDIYLDGGTFDKYTGDYQTKYKLLADGAKLYVTAKGGTLNVTADRGYITDGVHSETGVQSGTLVLSGGRTFISGTSTFNGYYEIQSGTKHFSNEAVATSKGIILNGGTLQYMGETMVTSTTSLACPIFIKGNCGIQCGWGGNFYLTGPITDWSGVSGKQLTIQTDGGTVWFNGLVNTTASIKIDEAFATNGANDITIGGLAGTNVNRGFRNSAAADTGKTFTLNVANGNSFNYKGQLTGLFNLVKDGQGVQVFDTTGIGYAASELNSVTVSKGVMKMTNGAPIYTKTLAVGANGNLLYDTGTYTLDVDTLKIADTGSVSLTFASDTDFTKLNVAGGFDVSSTMDGIFDFVTTNGYEMNYYTTYKLNEVFPDLGAEFDYDTLLKSGLQYEWNLSYNNGALYLSADLNAVPEPASWALLILGVLGLGTVKFFKKHGKNE